MPTVLRASTTRGARRASPAGFSTGARCARASASRAGARYHGLWRPRDRPAQDHARAAATRRASKAPRSTLRSRSSTSTPKRSGVTATAANGRRIHSRHLVFAHRLRIAGTGAAPGHKIVSTWAIATVAQPRRLWPGQCMIWEASDPYLYVRTTPEGRVICGGEDEEFSDEAERDALLDAQDAKRSQRKLGRLMPDLDTTVEFAWTGSFGQSATGLPTIGQIPEPAELLGRARLWRQRHHLFAHRGRHHSRARSPGGPTSMPICSTFPGKRSKSAAPSAARRLHLARAAPRSAGDARGTPRWRAHRRHRGSADRPSAAARAASAGSAPSRSGRRRRWSSSPGWARIRRPRSRRAPGSASPRRAPGRASASRWRPC